MRYTNSLHYIDGALKGQQWPRLAPICILILILILMCNHQQTSVHCLVMFLTKCVTTPCIKACRLMIKVRAVANGPVGPVLAGPIIEPVVIFV